MTWNYWIKKISESMIYFGLPIVGIYHNYTENPYINFTFKDATRIEKYANFFLIPTQFLFGGRMIKSNHDDGFKIEPRFDYNQNFYPKAVGSMILTPFSHFVGLMLKGIALIDKDVNLKHQKLIEWLNNKDIQSNLSYYEKLRIEIVSEDQMELADCQNYQRRKEDVETLKEDRIALKNIAKILKKKKIPFWIDCGTCLGAYRYGGVIPWDFDVDVSILKTDFWNAYKALKELDPNLYQVQDWSGRDRPASYLKVYVKKSHNLIDIYTFDIDEKEKTISYLISNENSIFLPESWKIRERTYVKPSKIEDVFPLKLAQFDGLYLPVPKKTKEYLQLRYGENIEPVKIFNPVTNQYEKDLSHPYWKISYMK